MNCSSDTQDDKFYDELIALVCQSKGCDIIVPAGDFSSQSEKRSAS